MCRRTMTTWIEAQTAMVLARLELELEMQPSLLVVVLVLLLLVSSAAASPATRVRAATDSAQRILLHDVWKLKPVTLRRIHVSRFCAT